RPCCCAGWRSDLHGQAQQRTEPEGPTRIDASRSCSSANFSQARNHCAVRIGKWIEHAEMVGAGYLFVACTPGLREHVALALELVGLEAAYDRIEDHALRKRPMNGR